MNSSAPERSARSAARRAYLLRLRPTILSTEYRVIEDAEQVPYLADGVAPTPRVRRRCALVTLGLLHAYFCYDGIETPSEPRKDDNSGMLRLFLRDLTSHDLTPSGARSHLDRKVKREQAAVGRRPGSATTAKSVLERRVRRVRRIAARLNIRQDSWLVWSVVIGQVKAATTKDRLPIRHGSFPG